MTPRRSPRLVFAASSASGTPDPMLSALVPMFEARGVSVVPLTLRLDTDERAQLVAFSEAIATIRGPYVVGGFSLGARAAAGLCVNAAQASPLEGAPVGLLGFGYPFHTLAVPPTFPGLDALRATTLPALIVQGTRDNHGSEAQVRGYRLPANVAITWLSDGNHRLIPRAKSGQRAEELLRAGVLAACAFLERL